MSAGRRMMLVVLAGLLLGALAGGEDRWESSMQEFEAADRQSAPPQNGIVFIGSSSIRMWNLKEYFPDLPVVNRGFGGSEIADSVRYADRILIPLKPRVVVLYAGDNDIAGGKSPEQVRTDFESFVAKVHGALPRTRIVFVAIKPSIARWKLVDKMREANRMIRVIIERDPLLGYADVDGPTLGADGRPRQELFSDDGLHLNADGYKLWTSLVRPLL